MTFRPGWTMQQMAMKNVDVKITQRGLTKVPISEMARLKVGYTKRGSYF